MPAETPGTAFGRLAKGGVYGSEEQRDWRISWFESHWRRPDDGDSRPRPGQRHGDGTAGDDRPTGTAASQAFAPSSYAPGWQQRDAAKPTITLPTARRVSRYFALTQVYCRTASMSFREYRPDNIRAPLRDYPVAFTLSVARYSGRDPGEARVGYPAERKLVVDRRGMPGGYGTRSSRARQVVSGARCGKFCCRCRERPRGSR